MTEKTSVGELARAIAVAVLEQGWEPPTTVAPQEPLTWRMPVSLIWRIANCHPSLWQVEVLLRAFQAMLGGGLVSEWERVPGRTTTEVMQLCRQVADFDMPSVAREIALTIGRELEENPKRWVSHFDSSVPVGSYSLVSRIKELAEPRGIEPLDVCQVFSEVTGWKWVHQWERAPGRKAADVIALCQKVAHG